LKKIDPEFYAETAKVLSPEPSVFLLIRRIDAGVSKPKAMKAL
jgi:hypothetical protein